MINTTKKAWPWLFVSLAAIVIDQVVKYWLNSTMTLNQVHTVLPFLNFTLRYNAGASFGFLNSASGWQMWLFSLVAIAVIVTLFIWLVKTPRNDWMVALAMSLIIGGACGNLIDRIHLSYVIDFVDFHVGAWHFATFNIADSAITLGAILWIIKLIFVRK